MAGSRERPEISSQRTNWPERGSKLPILPDGATPKNTKRGSSLCDCLAAFQSCANEKSVMNAQPMSVWVARP